MNYIRHLNAFFSFVRSDNRLTSSHVSLYMALFHYWNSNRFHNPFSIYRENIMQLAKIGSKNTYHKCIKELHEARYIFYHPAPSKFRIVRISIVRLDKEEEAPSRFKQLDLFFPPPDGVARSAGGGIKKPLSRKQDNPCPENGTDNVPKLGQHSTDFDTGTVSKMGHLNKPNIYKQRETPTHEIFKRNDKIQKAINEFGASVPNPGHHQPSENCHSDEGGISNVPLTTPSKQEVQSFFSEKKYPADEATKFFSHYKALGWKIQGKTPIRDWKPLVEKWMANAKKWNTVQENSSLRLPSGDHRGADLQYLYNSFLEGKNIFRHITTEHYDLLKLSLTDEIMQQAWKERINHVSGTNQHSIIELWKAYLTGDPASPLLQKDKPNLIDLAKRIAVINYLHHLKQSGVVHLNLSKGQPP